MSQALTITPAHYSMVDAPASASDTVGFNALAILTGKGHSATDKARQHINNGASVGALIAAGVQRKALIGALTAGDVSGTAHALASGNIRPAMALVVAKVGKAVSLMEVNGKAPYSEWLRLGAQLRAMPQRTTAGKPSKAAQGLALWNQYHEHAAQLRARRETVKALENAGLTEQAPTEQAPTEQAPTEQAPTEQ